MIIKGILVTMKDGCLLGAGAAVGAYLGRTRLCQMALDGVSKLKGLLGLAKAEAAKIEVQVKSEAGQPPAPPAA